MEKNFDLVLDGYKKSLQLLKKIDIATYKEFCSLFKLFNKRDVNAFFKNLKLSLTDKRAMLNSKSVVQINKVKKDEFKTITLYYGESLDLKIEFREKTSENEVYKKFTLCSLVDISDFIVGYGDVFFKLTTTINGFHNKNYYAMEKQEKGYKLFIQTNKNKINKQIKTEKLPAGGYSTIIK